MHSSALCISPFQRRKLDMVFTSNLMWWRNSENALTHTCHLYCCAHTHMRVGGRGGEGVCVYVYLYIFDLQAHEATRSCTGSAQRAALSRTEAALWIERVLNSCQTDFGKPWATFVSLKLRQRWNTSELKYTWLFCLKKKKKTKTKKTIDLFFPISFELVRVVWLLNALVSRIQETISWLKEEATSFEFEGAVRYVRLQEWAGWCGWSERKWSQNDWRKKKKSWKRWRVPVKQWMPAICDVEESLYAW